MGIIRVQQKIKEIKLLITLTWHQTFRHGKKPVWKREKENSRRIPHKIRVNLEGKCVLAHVEIVPFVFYSLNSIIDLPYDMESNSVNK